MTSSKQQPTGPTAHLILGFVCYAIWLALTPTGAAVRPSERPYPTDYFAATFVLLGAFLSGVHTLPAERLNGLAFTIVGAISGAMFVGLFNLYRWATIDRWATSDIVFEMIFAIVVASTVLVRLAGMAGKALNNPFGHFLY